MMGISFVKTLPQEGAKSAHFCSMKITEDVRRYAQEQQLSDEVALPFYRVQLNAKKPKDKA